MKPKKESSNTEMSEMSMEPIHLVQQLVLLIVEARTPHHSTKGKVEGPHCHYLVSGVDSGHCCTGDKIECVRADAFCTSASRLWSKAIPVCVDILLLPACIHGTQEVTVTEGVSTAATKDNALLVERWMVEIERRRPSQLLPANMLLQAVRSYLHFSQISSWLYSNDGQLPGVILAYRMGAPSDDLYQCPNLVDSHVFPVCTTNRQQLRVRVNALGRTNTIPRVMCFHQTCQKLGNTATGRQLATKNDKKIDDSGIDSSEFEKKKCLGKFDIRSVAKCLEFDDETKFDKKMNWIKKKNFDKASNGVDDLGVYVEGAGFVNYVTDERQILGNDFTVDLGRPFEDKRLKDARLKSDIGELRQSRLKGGKRREESSVRKEMGRSSVPGFVERESCNQHVSRWEVFENEKKRRRAELFGEEVDWRKEDCDKEIFVDDTDDEKRKQSFVRKLCMELQGNKNRQTEKETSCQLSATLPCELVKHSNKPKQEVVVEDVSLVDTINRFSVSCKGQDHVDSNLRQPSFSSSSPLSLLSSSPLTVDISCLEFDPDLDSDSTPIASPNSNSNTLTRSSGTESLFKLMTERKMLAVQEVGVKSGFKDGDCRSSGSSCGSGNSFGSCSSGGHDDSVDNEIDGGCMKMNDDNLIEATNGCKLFEVTALSDTSTVPLKSNFCDSNQINSKHSLPLQQRTPYVAGEVTDRKLFHENRLPLASYDVQTDSFKVMNGELPGDKTLHSPKVLFSCDVPSDGNSCCNWDLSPRGVGGVGDAGRKYIDFEHVAESQSRFFKSKMENVFGDEGNWPDDSGVEQEVELKPERRKHEFIKTCVTEESNSDCGRCQNLISKKVLDCSSDLKVIENRMEMNMCENKMKGMNREKEIDGGRSRYDLKYNTRNRMIGTTVRDFEDDDKFSTKSKTNCNEQIGGMKSNRDCFSKTSRCLPSLILSSSLSSNKSIADISSSTHESVVLSKQRENTTKLTSPSSLSVVNSSSCEKSRNLISIPTNRQSDIPSVNSPSITKNFSNSQTQSAFNSIGHFKSIGEFPNSGDEEEEISSVICQNLQNVSGKTSCNHIPSGELTTKVDAYLNATGLSNCNFPKFQTFPSIDRNEKSDISFRLQKVSFCDTDVVSSENHQIKLNNCMESNVDVLTSDLRMRNVESVNMEGNCPNSLTKPLSYLISSDNFVHNCKTIEPNMNVFNNCDNLNNNIPQVMGSRLCDCNDVLRKGSLLSERLDASLVLTSSNLGIDKSCRKGDESKTENRVCVENKFISSQCQNQKFYLGLCVDEMRLGNRSFNNSGLAKGQGDAEYHQTRMRNEGRNDSGYLSGSAKKFQTKKQANKDNSYLISNRMSGFVKCGDGEIGIEFGHDNDEESVDDKEENKTRLTNDNNCDNDSKEHVFFYLEDNDSNSFNCNDVRKYKINKDDENDDSCNNFRMYKINKDDDDENDDNTRFEIGDINFTSGLSLNQRYFDSNNYENSCHFDGSTTANDNKLPEIKNYDSDSNISTLSSLSSLSYPSSLEDIESGLMKTDLAPPFSTTMTTSTPCSKTINSNVFHPDLVNQSSHLSSSQNLPVPNSNNLPTFLTSSNSSLTASSLNKLSCNSHLIQSSSLPLSSSSSSSKVRNDKSQTRNTTVVSSESCINGTASGMTGSKPTSLSATLDDLDSNQKKVKAASQRSRLSSFGHTSEAWDPTPPSRSVSTPNCMEGDTRGRLHHKANNVRNSLLQKSVTNLSKQDNLTATSTLFSRTSLPSQSSPAPLKRNPGGRFDYDSSLVNVRAIKNAFSCSKLAVAGNDNHHDDHQAKRTLSTSAPASTNCLLGNFEESILNGRIDPVGIVSGFTAEIGASGVFCPKHLHLPVSAFFFDLSDDKAPSPYLGHINLKGGSKKGYHIPNKGTLQVTLFNPNRTVVKMFVVMYDLTDMPNNSQTFIRQRTMYVPCDRNSTAPVYLRYLIHLRCYSSKTGKIYLHTDIRLIFARHKLDIDAKTIPYEMKSFTELPRNPKYSPKK